jgi:hypothetical protein
MPGGRCHGLAVGPILLLAALAAIAAASLLAGATITGDQPPASGDWLVTHPTTVTDETVTVAGGIVVSSQLAIERSTVQLAPAANGSVGVEVAPTGRLEVNGSKFASSTAFGYLFVVRGELDVNGSTLQNCHAGVQVLTDERVSIVSTWILHPYLVGLSLVGANNTTIRDVHVKAYLWQMPVITATGVADDTNPLCHVLAMAPGMVRVVRCAPTIDGLDVTVGRRIPLDVRLEKRTASARFIVDLQGPLVEVADGGVLRASNLTLYDSVDLFTRNILVYNYVQGGSSSVTVHATLTGVLGIGDVGIELSGVTMRRCSWMFQGNPGTVSQQGYPSSVTVYRVEPMPCLVTSVMDAKFEDAGPHRMRVRIEDCSIESSRLLECALYPRYVGTAPPTFELDARIEGSSTLYGMDLIELEFEPSFTMLKTLKVSVHVANCTFTRTIDSVLNVSYLPGTVVIDPETGGGRQWFILEDDLSIEGCTFDRCAGGASPTIWARTQQGLEEHVNIYERRWQLRDCAFEGTYGWLFGLKGHEGMVQGHESLAVDSCTFTDCSGQSPLDRNHNDQWMAIEDWDRVTISNSTFANTRFIRGILLTDQGGDGQRVAPAYIKVSDNVFRNSTIFGEDPSTAELLLVRWGGDLEVCRNDISLSQMVFLNASEVPEYAWYSRLVFHNNTAHDYAGTVVMLSRVDSKHTMLDATIRDNTARNLTGPLVDYPRLAIEVGQRDFDPVVNFLYNTAINCSATVLSCYGDIVVDGNRFEDCTDYAVRLVQLHLNQPLIGNNTFVRCQDAYYIGSKFWVPAPTLLFVTGDSVSCTGTAYRFYKMEATMRNVTVSADAATAIVAEESLVDVFNSSIEIGSGEVIWRGHIRVWLDLEAFAEWFNATGAPSGRGVPYATLQYRDSTGALMAVGHSGADGRVEPVTLKQWSIEWYVGPLASTVHTPYNVTGTCSSYSGVLRVDLVIGLVGDGAVHVPVVDTDPPVVRITWPLDGNLTNEYPLNVTGLMSDLGSGILNITLWWDGGGGPVDATLLPGERFAAATPLPDGTRSLTALALDVAGNPARHTVTVIVDHTPPALVITEPPDGLITPNRTLRLRGTFEPGCRVWIDIAEQPGETGVLDTPIQLLEGPNVVTIKAVDRAGNWATVVLHLTLDTIPPTLLVYHPKDRSSTNASLLPIDGRAEGASVVELRVVHPSGEVVTGSVVPSSDWSFLTHVQLSEGRNVVTVRAVDLAGNEAVATLDVTLDSIPPEVVILSPDDGTVTREPSVHVIARVGLDAVQVLVNGKRVSGRPDIDAVVVLIEGVNVITVRAQDDLGNERAERITITLDTVAPHVIIDSPAADPLVTNDPVVRIAGRVEGGADRVTVAGRDVLLEGGAFQIVLTLQLDGMHQVAVVATDLAGNSALVTLTVELDRTPPLLELIFDPPDARIRGGDGRLTLFGRTDPTAIRVVVNITTGGRTQSSALVPGDDALFNLTMSLGKGGNTVVVSVLDRYGNWNVAEPHEVVFEKAPDEGVSPLVRPAAILTMAIIAAVSILAGGLYLARRRRGKVGGGGRRA